MNTASQRDQSTQQSLTKSFFDFGFVGSALVGLFEHSSRLCPCLLSGSASVQTHLHDC